MLNINVMLSQTKTKKYTRQCIMHVKYLVSVCIHPCPARRVEAGQEWKF